MEIRLSDGSICDDKNKVIYKWKNDFANISNQNNDHSYSVEILNNNIICEEFLDSKITIDEVYHELKLTINGVDNELTRIFNICYNVDKEPHIGSKDIITPIPKSSTSDPCHSLSYRGLTLAPLAYKLYCGVLNARLTVKLDDMEVINDEQKAFRKERSIIDHGIFIYSMIIYVIIPPNLLRF